MSETFDPARSIDAGGDPVAAGDTGVVGTWSDESEFAGWEDTDSDGDQSGPTVPTPTLAELEFFFSV